MPVADLVCGTYLTYIYIQSTIHYTHRNTQLSDAVCVRSIFKRYTFCGSQIKVFHKFHPYSICLDILTNKLYGLVLYTNIIIGVVTFSGIEMVVLKRIKYYQKSSKVFHTLRLNHVLQLNKVLSMLRCIRPSPKSPEMLCILF